MSQLLISMQARLRVFLHRLAPHEVDDLVQETMARAWRSRHAFDPERGSGESWLLRIAFRAFLDHRKRAPATLPGADNQTDDRADPAHHAEVRDHTASLLEQLSPVERDVLLRFHRDHESVTSIGRSMNMPVGTVKSHLHRARNRMWTLQHLSGGNQ